MEYYFDFVSPYAYLEMPIYKEWAREVGEEFRPIPVVLAGLLRHFDRKGPAEMEAVRRYVFADVTRWAAKYNLPFAFPPGHPFNPLLPLRVVTALIQEERLEEATKAAEVIYRAIWAESRPAWEGDCLVEVLDQGGFEGKTLVEKGGDSSVKKALIDFGGVAISHGVFGVPTIRIRGKNLWGAGRLDFARSILEGSDANDGYDMEEILSRPRLADRK